MAKKPRVWDTVEDEHYSENMATWGLKYPEKLVFNIDEDVAREFRRHCAMKDRKLGDIVTNLIVDYLIEQGELKDRSILDRKNSQ